MPKSDMEHGSGNCGPMLQRDGMSALAKLWIALVSDFLPAPLFRECIDEPTPELLDEAALYACSFLYRSNGLDSLCAR